MIAAFRGPLYLLTNGGVAATAVLGAGDAVDDRPRADITVTVVRFFVSMVAASTASSPLKRPSGPGRPFDPEHSHHARLELDGRLGRIKGPRTGELGQVGGGLAGHQRVSLELDEYFGQSCSYRASPSLMPTALTGAFEQRSAADYHADRRHEHVDARPGRVVDIRAPLCRGQRVGVLDIRAGSAVRGDASTYHGLACWAGAVPRSGYAGRERGLCDD